MGTHNNHTTDKPVALEVPIELEFRNRSKDENQQQTQPTYDTGSRIWTRATISLDNNNISLDNNNIR